MLSGKFVLRVDPKLHKSLRDEASKKGESLNSLCVRKISGGTTIETSPWQNIVERIKAEFQPVGIVLFGSVARGEQNSKSDIDLLIVLAGGDSVSRESYKRWDRLAQVSEKFSPQFVHLPKANEAVGSIWLENAIEGEILYDQADTLKKTFLEIRRKIALGFYVRKQSHGQFYWVRQDSDAK